MIRGEIDSLNNNKAATKHNHGAMPVYVIFVTVALFVYHLIAEGEFSSVLTVSAIFQCLAFSILGLQAATDGVESISAKSLQLDALALACRLSSTVWLNGYLPNDFTGDYLYQCFDALSLGMVLWLLHRVKTVQQQLGQVDEGGLSVAPLALGSLLLASLLHADLNARPLFDALWMCGLFIGTISVLPQLWMMQKKNRKSVPALTCHFVAVMALSRVLSGSYMWYAHEEIDCTAWVGDFNHSGYAILAAHAVHLLLLGDFAYFYGKNLVTSGLHAPLQLSDEFLV